MNWRRVGRRRKRRSSASSQRLDGSTSCGWKPSERNERGIFSASRRSATARSRTLEKVLSGSSDSDDLPVMVKEEVDEDDIATTVSRWTGIPVD